MGEAILGAVRRSGRAGRQKWIIGAALIPATLLLGQGLLFSRWTIPGGSMRPTVEAGDVILAPRLSYVDLGPAARTLARSLGLDWFRSGPERGDVAIFTYPGPNPEFRGRHYIKRVVGLPGERVQVSNGILHIYGSPVERQPLVGAQAPSASRMPSRLEPQRFIEVLPSGLRYTIFEIDDRQTLDNTPVFTVPQGHYFVMGDNRDNSQDGRSEGGWFVPRDNVVGRANLVAFSFEGGTSPWAPWEWPGKFRPARLLKAVQ
jgi:signal peptidase I